MFILNHSPNKYSEIKNCLSFRKRSSTHQIHSLHVLTKVLQVLRRPWQTDEPIDGRLGQRATSLQILLQLSQQPQDCVMKPEVHNYHLEALSNPGESEQQQQKMFWSS